MRVLEVIYSATEKSRVNKDLALFDTGATHSMIDQKLAEVIDPSLTSRLRPLRVKGCNSSRSCKGALLTLILHGFDGRKYPVEFITYPNLNLGERVGIDWVEASKTYEHLQDIPLKKTSTSDVRMLLGTNAQHLFLPPLGWKSGRPGDPIALLGALGWTIGGSLDTRFLNLEDMRDEIDINILENYHDWSSQRIDSRARALGLPMPSRIYRALKRQEEAETEGFTYEQGKSIDDELALEIFEQTIKPVQGGLEMRYPWKDPGGPAPNTIDMVKRRQEKFHEKLDKGDSWVKMKYYEGIQKDVEKGFIRKLSDEELQVFSEVPRKLLIPVFYVQHPDKPDKIRRVIDGAAGGRFSVNSLMFKGPDNLAYLNGVIWRVRLGKFAVCADINDMFSNIRVPIEDQYMQAFLVKDLENTKKFHVYCNTRVVFGFKASPAMANFALQYAAKLADQSEDYPVKIEAITKKQFYVDDLTASFDTIKEASAFITVIKLGLFEKGGFPAAKFTATHEEILTSIKEEDKDARLFVRMIGDEEEEYQKTLGILWNRKKDTYSFCTRIFDKENDYKTFIHLLSGIMSVYDPCGYVLPIMVSGRLIQREAFQACQKMYDHPLDENTREKWLNWLEDLKKIQKINVPRWYGTVHHQDVELIIFTDASELAFGACTYLRFKNEEKWDMKLVQAKFSMAPRKTVGSIHQLELDGACMGFKLALKVFHELKGCLNIKKVRIFTDNSVVLGRFKNSVAKYNKYVAVRLSKMRIAVKDITGNGTEVEFKYCPTKQNPADILTRPLSAAEFLAHIMLWQEGPEKLKTEDLDWRELHSFQEIPWGMSKDVDVTLTQVTTDFGNLNETWEEVIQRRAEEKTEEPTSEDLSKTEMEILIEAQENSLSKEFKRLKEVLLQDQNKSEAVIFLNKGRLLRVSVLMKRSEGLMRIWGRFQDSSLCFEEKHPIIVADEGLCMKILKEAHEHTGHQGRNTTKAHARKKYYVLNSSRLAGRVIAKCDVCKAARAGTYNTPLAPYHFSRFSGDKVWSWTAIDMFGPISLSNGTNYKALILVCLKTRAVHLELLKNETTECFLNALVRFMSLRAAEVKNIVSDGGKNFVGGDNCWSAWLKERSKLGINYDAAKIIFHQVPTNHPHWNGTAERMVGILKDILMKLLSDHPPKSYDALQTLFCRANYMVNLRPIGFDNNGVPFSAQNILHPSAEASLDPEALPSKYFEYVLERQAEFWTKFREHILNDLSQQYWHKGKVYPPEVPKVGVRVLVHTVPSGTQCWQYGTIKILHEGSDGIVRTVTVDLDGKGDRLIDVKKCIPIPEEANFKISEEIRKKHSKM